MGFILNLWQFIYGSSSRCFLSAMHLWYTFITKCYPWALHCQQQQNVVYNNSSKLDLFFSYLVLFSHVSLDKIAFLWSGHSVFKGLSLVFDLGFWIFHLNTQFRGCFWAVYLAGKILFWLAWILQFAVKQYLNHAMEWMKILVPAAHSWDPFSTSPLLHSISDTVTLPYSQVASVYILKQNSALKETKSLGTGSALKSRTA